MLRSREFCVLLVEREPFLEGDYSRVHVKRFKVPGLGALPVVPDISEHTIVPVRDGAQCRVVTHGALVEGFQLVMFGLNLSELRPLLVEQGPVAGDDGSILSILFLEVVKELLLPLLLRLPPV